jgi:hypothetical protein
VMKLWNWSLQQSGKLSATRGSKDNMGDQVDPPTNKEELQPRRLHKKSQPLEQLDRVIEEIRKLMLRSAQEAVNKEGDEQKRACHSSREEKKKKTEQQQHSWRGARGQLQKRVWDPGGFQHWRRGAHEQELMFFLAVEYDAGASLHLSKCANMPTQDTQWRKGEAPTLPFLNLK